MKMIFKAVAATAIILSSISLSGQDTIRLSLDSAINYALSNNKALLNARDKVTSSKEKNKEIIAQGLPQIEGSLDYMTYFNYELNFKLGNSSASSVDFNQPPFDDGDRAVMGAIGQMFGSSKPIIMSDQMSGKVQLSQLLFSGQYIKAIQIAKIARKLSDQSLVLSELDVKENVTNSYYVIITNEHTLRIIGENLNNLNSIMQHTNNMYKAGMMEETDVDQLKITVSQLKNNQKMLERMLQLSYNMLKFQMGIPPDAIITLADSLEQIIGYINPQSSMLPSFDITNNINYQLIESQVSLTKKQVDVQKWAYAPTVAAFYSYTEKFMTTGFDMTPKQLAGVSLSVPIFSSGMRKSKVSQAKIDLDIAQRNQEMIKDQLETQKKQLLYNYQSALENYDTQKESVSIAGRVYKSIQNKYKQGLASSLDLTQANSNYLTAENNYLTSVLTLLQAQTSLKKLYNTL
jgi:outer membrane protein